MDIKKVISFDKGIRWKADHTSNPYAIVLKAKKIWYFTEKENTNSYTFFKLAIQDNAKPFKWGCSTRKQLWFLNIKSIIILWRHPTSYIEYYQKKNRRKKEEGDYSCILSIKIASSS